MKRVVLIGAGGHGKTVLSFLKGTNGLEVAGFVEKPGVTPDGLISGFPVIGCDDQLPALFAAGFNYALITLGSVGNNQPRARLYQLAESAGFTMINATHPSAQVATEAILGKGVTVMAQAVIGPDTAVGNNVIINTGAIIEHDCIVNDHVHVAPGVRVAGGVKIGEDSHLGIGSVVIQGVTIGRNALIGAGTVVIKDVPDGAVVVGVPGKIMRYRE